MNINKQDLEELKKNLLAEKEKLEKDLNKIAKPVDSKKGDYETSFDDIGSDKDDNATEVDQYTQNLSVETALEKRLQKIVEALDKMDKGTYGICINCQGEIPIERLKANPSSQTCNRC